MNPPFVTASPLPRGLIAVIGAPSPYALSGIDLPDLSVGPIRNPFPAGPGRAMGGIPAAVAPPTR
ncbi:hypothetical protein GCM10027612_05750 [Microbispora bryophytorum subsp. camponoti]